MTFIISIICFSITCERMPRVPHAYQTKHACERALIAVAKKWKPIKGGYIFNCVPRESTMTRA